MDGQFEATFEEIIRHVENNYRTPGTQASRAIAGLSMGGFHAAHIALHYPGTFDYIGLFSSALGAPRSAEAAAPVYEDQDGKLNLLQEKGYRLYWMAIGVDDFPILLEGNAAFRDQMDALGMTYEYLETAGGHTWNNWRDYLVISTQRLFK